MVTGPKHNIVKYINIKKIPIMLDTMRGFGTRNGSINKFDQKHLVFANICEIKEALTFSRT
jgi:hypothetical protein